MVGILYISYDSTKTVLDIINIFEEIGAVVLYIYHNKRGYINKARKTMSYSKKALDIFLKRQYKPILFLIDFTMVVMNYDVQYKIVIFLKIKKFPIVTHLSICSF